MHLFCAILLGISCLFLGCAYHPPINEIPQYGFPEISIEKIQADPIYQRDLAYAQRADSTHEAVNQLIAEGFARLEHTRLHNNPYIIESFNRAWLLDSLNPHIYMGFALYEMADWNNGSRKKAVEYYTKYRNLYQKNPVPCPHKTNLDDNISPASTNKDNLIYGKLLDLKKDNGRDGYWETNWASVAIGNSLDDVDYHLKTSNILPENERYTLSIYLNAKGTNARGIYTKGKIEVIKFFDKQSGEWKQAPKDSIYEFLYVEYQGLFFNEEQGGLVTLGNTFPPDSSARIFRLKPYAMLNDALIMDSYSENISQDELKNITPKDLKLKPYQTRNLHPQISGIPVRSNIIRALEIGKYDSLRIYLNTALEFEKKYGTMPITNNEYLILNLLDPKTEVNSAIIKKLGEERTNLLHGKEARLYDTLELLIAYRCNTYFQSTEFKKKMEALPNSSKLKEYASLFIKSLKKQHGFAYFSGFGVKP